MLMQITMQFQQDIQINLQATQSTLQTNTQTIAKIEIQMGQLATSLSEREKGKFPSQPVANPKGQYEIESSSHHEQAKVITTLRSGRVVNNQVGDSNLHDKDDIDDRECVDKTNHCEESTNSKDPEPPTSTFLGMSQSLYTFLEHHIPKD